MAGLGKEYKAGEVVFRQGDKGNCMFVIQDGEVVPGQPTVDIATIDFLARGGDAYPFRGAPFTTLGVTYQQTLENYLREIATVTAADYPEGGEGRIGIALFGGLAVPLGRLLRVLGDALARLGAVDGAAVELLALPA